MIHFTPAARREIRRMGDRQSIRDPKIRMNIGSGGCLGLYYQLSLTEEIQTSDQMCRDDDLCILIEPGKQGYLQGLIIDYSEDLMGGGFRFQNPNVTQTCSCSNSFSVLPVEAETPLGAKAV